LIIDGRSLYFTLPRLLAHRGEKINIVAARSGKQAMEILMMLPVDLLIMDLKLPVMEKVALFDFLERQRQVTPVLVMSSGSGGRRLQGTPRLEDHAPGAEAHS